MTANLTGLTRPTYFLDHDHPVVAGFAAKALAGLDEGATDVDKAVRLYYAVRDGILYDVYHADLSRAGLTASAVIGRGRGFCLHKSIVYAAVVRAAGIPSRITYGDVRNHLASPRLRDLVGGDVFFHSLTTVHLDGRWVRATPVFNKLLCRLYGMAPLEFDGRADSLYHPFDGDGNRHMEFLKFYGDFDDVPFDLVISTMRSKHPKFLSSASTTPSGSLIAEAP
ncbi:transglutaminase family protein [Dactylosporangium maewongense]|uniref:Transglutaminase family protein n=1 Tax=Dactylosporangium maewongense TaxID=634393 RepID=A0ABP4LP21_9ACTN